MITETVSNNFLATLQRHRGGKILAEGSTKLQELVAAVHESGKGGTLTLKITVKPAARGQCAVALSDNIKVQMPQVEPENSFWFSTPIGELCKDDPRQREIPFTPVTGGKIEDQQSAAHAVAR